MDRIIAAYMRERYARANRIDPTELRDDLRTITRPLGRRALGRVGPLLLERLLRRRARRRRD
jgi:hypothetical protein